MSEEYGWHPRAGTWPRRGHSEWALAFHSMGDGEWLVQLVYRDGRGTAPIRGWRGSGDVISPPVLEDMFAAYVEQVRLTIRVLPSGLVSLPGLEDRTHPADGRHR